VVDVQGPRAWTPTTARLVVRAGGATVVAIDHAAPVRDRDVRGADAAGGLVARVVDARGARDAVDLAGAIAIVDAAGLARPKRGRAQRLGFITDATCRRGRRAPRAVRARRGDAAGRLERHRRRARSDRGGQRTTAHVGRRRSSRRCRW
jgi:hypothetical protein